MAAVDEALLMALVQDVWDKFVQQRSMLQSRQRHESEALWLLQRDQWGGRTREIGGFKWRVCQGDTVGGFNGGVWRADHRS